MEETKVQENGKVEENEKVKEFKKIKVIIKHVEIKEKKLDFYTYKTPDESGKLIDLRFRRENDLKELNQCKKAYVTLERLDDASDYYEYPRYYADGIVSVEKIV